MKILFLDLDGTLLNDQKEITPKNREALQKALQQGHRVVITTGRPLASAKIQNQRLGLTEKGCYIIAFNGGVIYDCGEEKPIYENYLPKEIALKALRICNQTGVHAQGYDATHVLVEADHNPEFLKRYCDSTGNLSRQVESFQKSLPDGVPKVLAISFTERAALERAEKALKAQISDVADCFYSCNEYLEVVAKGLNKGTAITRLCGMLNIPIENSIACGDQENDLGMIQTAGVGVAMANAIQKLKACADYVTVNDNNHDGIAEVVEKYLLK